MKYISCQQKFMSWCSNTCKILAFFSPDQKLRYCHRSITFVFIIEHVDSMKKWYTYKYL